MKKLVFFAAVAAAVLCLTAGTGQKKAMRQMRVWRNYDVGEVLFRDKAPETRGSVIYHDIIPNPEQYITDAAHEVLSVLYKSPKDSIRKVEKIFYSIEDREGISAKSGRGNRVNIFYSTRHVEKSFRHNDTAKVLFETRGVLLHELTHAYQLEPQGVGTYGTNKVNWAFIEGMADAVRVACGGFEGPNARPRGGHYLDGYRITGYFLVWIRDNKDLDFLWKFNRSALEVVPWSFDGAIKHILGPKYEIEALWHEYQVAVGDIKE